MKKVSIAIVDDESLVRLGIKSSVEWEKHGYEIIGEAGNGQDGWEMIQRKKPDIVLLDICMPVMDGITVLKKIQEMGMPCKTIILSCHDDFQYVKEAMKNGAYDYLRKNDINSMNILQILEEVRGAIRTEESTAGMTSGAQEWQQNYSKLTCLQRLITDERESLEHPDFIRKLRITQSGLYCAVFGISHYQQILARYENSYPFSLESGMLNLAKEILRQKIKQAEVFILHENRYVLLLSNPEKEDTLAWEAQVLSLLEDLHITIQNYLNVETFYGLSSVVSRFTQLPTAFGEARYAAELHYFRPENRIIQEKRKPDRTLDHPEICGLTRSISAAVSLKQYSQALDGLQNLIDWLRRRARENLDVWGVQQFFSNTAHLILLQDDQVLNESVQALPVWEDLDHTERYFREFRKRLIQPFPERDGTGKNQRHYLIRAATAYIQENLSRGDISLDEISDHLAISKSYLCRLFQKNMGISVQQYIHTVRIEKAKEYLKDFHLKIYEVAELTGFNSSTHFNIVFKKIMQCTPAEYRNGLE